MTLGAIITERRTTWGTDISTKVVGVSGNLVLILRFKTIRTGFYPEYYVQDATNQARIDSALLTGGSLTELCERYGFDYQTAHHLSVGN